MRSDARVILIGAIGHALLMGFRSTVAQTALVHCHRLVTVRADHLGFGTPLLGAIAANASLAILAGIVTGHAHRSVAVVAPELGFGASATFAIQANEITAAFTCSLGAIPSEVFRAMRACPVVFGAVGGRTGIAQLVTAQFAFPIGASERPGAVGAFGLILGHRLRVLRRHGA